MVYDSPTSIMFWDKTQFLLWVWLPLHMLHLCWYRQCVLVHLELLKSLQTGVLASVSVAAVPLLSGCWLEDCAGEG